MQTAPTIVKQIKSSLGKITILFGGDAAGCDVSDGVGGADDNRHHDVEEEENAYVSEARTLYSLQRSLL